MRGPSKPPHSTASGPANPTPALTSLVMPATAAYSDTPESVSWLVYRYPSRVVYDMSESNWDIMFEKVRQWIQAAHASSAGGAVDGPTDVMDIKLTACSALDATRLSSVFSELSSLLVRTKEKPKLAISSTPRQTIWNWIEVHLKEYTDFLAG